MQNKITAYVFLLCLFFSLSAVAQSVYAPLNPDYYSLVERYEIKYGKFAEGMHSQVKPYLRQSIVQLTDSVGSHHNFLSQRDHFNLNYLRNDSWEWSDSAQNDSRRPVFKHFYQKKSDLFQHRQDDFEVHVSPVLYLGVGTESGTGTRTYINTRGAEVRGMISKKLGFYTFLADNQAVFPSYVRERVLFFNAVPNEGFWKHYSSTKGGVDFITARGYLTFTPLKNVHMQFGHDKNFIGTGYRSMILSDYSNSYLFLKTQVRVWKLQYTWLLTQMNGNFAATANQAIPKKYLAFHHLSINVRPNLNLGLFESVVYGSDSGGYDLNYANPIIFYRSLEQQSGSSGNALLGADFKWNFLRHFSLYGQFILDEFFLKNVTAGNGWWANKYAAQIGLKYVDIAGIANLDMQAEFNIARPYTYTHLSQYTNYTHYSQSLAHPLGANFKEVIGIVRYQPLSRLQLTATGMYAEYGTDPNTSQNWGGNILLPYTTHVQEYGNKIGQGNANYQFMVDLTASLQVKQNVFLDFKQVFRQLNSTNTLDKNISYTSIAFRMNIAPRQQTF
ncbi:MAG: hypothetical protein V4714_10015 [Bacteroidota bacterium]